MTSSSLRRDNFLSEAKIAKESGNYEKMTTAMKSLASLNVELTEEEQDLLRCAFKGKIVLQKTHEKQLLTDQNSDKNIVASEITKICDDLISLIDRYLLPSSRNVTARVLYYKLKGDAYMYMQEYRTSSTSERRDLVKRCRIAYNKAYELAQTHLCGSSYLRLNVALNMTVLLGEMMGEKFSAVVEATHACKIATYYMDLNEKLIDMDFEKLSERQQRRERLQSERLRLQPVLEKLQQYIAAWEAEV